MIIDTELLKGAWDGLRSHMLRSSLTTIGVIFGVAAVIGMSSIGEGAKREALRQIEIMGASNILVDEARPEDGEESEEAAKWNPDGLTLSDAEALQTILNDAVRIVPQRMGERMVTAGDKRIRLNIVATTPDYFQLHKANLAEGRWLTNLDSDDAQRVCIMGWGAKRELFPIESPIGKHVRIDNNLLKVVGILDRQWTGGDIQGFTLRDQNLDIYLPLTTAMTRFPPSFGETELNRITVQMPNPVGLNRTAIFIEKLINRRHQDVSDTKVVVPLELLKQHQETQRIFNIVMGTIASISLLVGGIGIMNIMLASVLERTREIGIRRALGARQKDISRQFLTESVLLSLSGGIIGVVFGILLAHGISLYAEWETAVSGWAILVAVGVSMAVGVIFGYLPARRAAKMDPITALRYE